MKITRLCFGLVLLGGFIPTAQALPLPESYFTPQVFSTMLVERSFAERLGGKGEVAGIKFTFDGIRTDSPRSNCNDVKPPGGYDSCYVHPTTFKAVPGSLQASPDPDFTAVDCIPGNTTNLCSALVVASKGVPPQSPGPYSFTTTFTFDKPLPGACHIFVDDVDQYLNAAFRFFDENGVLLNPRNYLVNDISDISLLTAPPPPLKGMPKVTKSSTEILFEGKSGKGYRELTQEIIPDVNTIKRIEFRFFNSKIQSGGVGVYFSCSAPPHIRKAFKPDTIKQGEVSKLEFEIDVFGNPLFNAGFTDTLPAGLKVADPSNAVTHCGGGSTVSVTRDAVNGDQITLHNLNLPYKNYDPTSTPDRCTVSVDVTNRPLQENASCTSLPDAFTNKETNFNGDSFNKTGLSACLIVSNPIPTQDFGDAPKGYGTILPSGARHTIAGPYLGAVRPDAEPDGQPGAAADGDDTNPSGGPDDEDGVTYQSFVDAPGKLRIEAHVTGVNATGRDALLCGYLDGASGDGTISGNFLMPTLHYVAPDLVVGEPGNEAICVQVSGQANVMRVSTFGGGAINSATCGAIAANGEFSCTLTFNPDFTSAVTTYARLRLTADPAFSVSKWLSPVESANDGEVEDDLVLINPTAVSIGSVDLQALPAATFLGGLGIEQMDDAAVLAMLEAWDPAAAASLAAADRDTILSALNEYLDPDGDGQVAVLAWDTLEERGTIGFYVERQVEEGDWMRINANMLPGLITAPMGAEYQLADPGARAGTVYNYRLIEQEARGNTRTYGPYTVEMQ